MTLRNEIGVILKQNGWSITDVAEKLYPDNRYPSQTLNNKLSNENLKYTEAKQIAEIIGCKIVWQRKSIKESICINDDISKQITSHTKESAIDRILKSKIAEEDTLIKDEYQLELIINTIQLRAVIDGISIDDIICEMVNELTKKMIQKSNDMKEAVKEVNNVINNRGEPTD